ncbi:MAG: hypothetical protein QM786_08045 [Breznakibacter sp.]
MHHSEILTGEGFVDKTISLAGTDIVVRWLDNSAWLKTLTLGSISNTPAKRMFNEAAWLFSNHIEVEIPIGYVEIASGIKVHKCAYFRKKRKLVQVSAYANRPLSLSNSIVMSVAKTVYKLHQMGVVIGEGPLETIKIDETTSNAVWVVNGRLSLQHKSITSRKAIKDLESIAMPPSLQHTFVKKYIEHAATSAYNSFDQWVFYQDVLKATQPVWNDPAKPNIT